MIKAEVIIDNTAWKKKIRNTTLLFNKILKNLPKKYILKNMEIHYQITMSLNLSEIGLIDNIILIKKEHSLISDLNY